MNIETFYKDEMNITDAKEWCEENNAHYYARPSSCYSEREAIQEAFDLGKAAVLLEEIY